MMLVLPLAAERDHVSQSLTPSSTVNDRTDIGGTSPKGQFDRARCERTER